MTNDARHGHVRVQIAQDKKCEPVGGRAIILEPKAENHTHSWRDNIATETRAFVKKVTASKEERRRKPRTIWGPYFVGPPQTQSPHPKPSTQNRWPIALRMRRRHFGPSYCTSHFIVDRSSPPSATVVSHQ